MASKRPKTALQADIRTAAIDAALRLAAKRDWANVSLKDIARSAKVSLADLSAAFEGKEDIVSAYGRRVDRDVLNAYPDGVPGSTEKDRLFDMLMERFDRMNNDRNALVSIINASCTDPKQIVISLPGVARSMLWSMEACGIDTNGWRGAARVTALSGVYLWAMKSWKDDDSADLAKTMAVLDRGLDKYASFTEALGI